MLFPSAILFFLVATQFRVHDIWIGPLTFVDNGFHCLLPFKVVPLVILCAVRRAITVTGLISRKCATPTGVADERDCTSNLSPIVSVINAKLSVVH